MFEDKTLDEIEEAMRIDIAAGEDLEVAFKAFEDAVDDCVESHIARDILFTIRPYGIIATAKLPETCPRGMQLKILPAGKVTDVSMGVLPSEDYKRSDDE